jgi:hypothetical protein
MSSYMPRHRCALLGLRALNESRFLSERKRKRKRVLLGDERYKRLERRLRN